MGFDKKRYNIIICIAALAIVVTLTGMINKMYLLVGIGITATIASLPFLLKAKLDYYRNVRDATKAMRNLLRDKDK